MNKIKAILFFFIFYSSCFHLYAQTDNSIALKLCNKALTFERAGNNDSAIYYYQKTLAFNKETFGEKHPIVAMTYGIIGDFYLTIKNFDLALKFHQQSLTLLKELYGENNEKVASAYTFVGFDYNGKSDYESALQDFKTATTIYIDIYGENNASVAFCYNIIAETYIFLKKYDSALEYFTKDLTISKQILAENHPDLAAKYNNLGNIYKDKGEFDLALENYQKGLAVSIVVYGENHQKTAEIYKSLGTVLNSKGDYDSSLQYIQKALIIDKNTFGENSSNVAELYSMIGVNYMTRGSMDTALLYYQKAFNINKDVFGENNFIMYDIYNNYGRYYSLIGDYDFALKYFQKAVTVLKTVVDENHPDLAMLYNNIGLIFWHKDENDLALQYIQKALFIHNKYFSENHPDVALYCNNMGLVYKDEGNEDLALEYFQKAYKINENIVGGNQIDLNNSYVNIGLVYEDKGDFNQALNYLQKSITLVENKFGEMNSLAARSYNYIGEIYEKKGDYNLALNYYKKALIVNKKIFGEKHPEVARNYNNIASIFALKNGFNNSLKYYQKGLVANLKDFNDTVNLKSNPLINNYADPNRLLNSLLGKAQAFYQLEDSRTALGNLQLADVLINQMRKTSSSQSDKIAFAQIAYLIYDCLIPLCLEMSINPPIPFTKKTLYEESFIYSESNKAEVLLEALAGQESLKFSGIPDSLLQKEHNMSLNINFFDKKVAESSDAISKTTYQNELFKLNQQYNELIAKFEKEYPNYYDLKYATKSPKVKEIQNILDDKTAIRSYFIGDSSICIFTLTNKKLYADLVLRMKNLNDSIVWFRYGLTKTSPRMQENYRRIGFSLYQQLFPESAPIDKQIENLIIIPDGVLAIIPFESLLTSNYTGDIDDYKNYPFLIKKYNISYSYSANLFYRTFSKQKSPSIEITKLNDWLAFAPVFDNSGDQTRELQKQLNWLKTDSTMINRSMFDRNYIMPLPATETETEAIFKLYDERNLKAKVLLHNNANEQFVKSGELAKYKVLHFATHGFVNSERPELSGLLLAQDTTGGEDGVLYSGEIYNLKLNADLVLLSACETGLGKIQKGEGIIGLTRALLYAGAKNIIVSLWQVEDESTSDLMVDFYKNFLEESGAQSYSEALRNAKLKMISKGKYAHPLFWSPFILIGK